MVPGICCFDMESGNDLFLFFPEALGLLRNRIRLGTIYLHERSEQHDHKIIYIPINLDALTFIHIKDYE